jgi:hypothetical protein
MPIVLDLRERLSHTGIPLVHPTSEHVVLANVFGTVKNFASDSAINPWLQTITQNDSIRSAEWKFSFWERQQKPIGPVGEGSTEVDLILESDSSLVFVEVKMDAEASRGTTSDPDRHQLIRNLDIGYSRACRVAKAFALIYVTPNTSEPDSVVRLRKEPQTFPANPDVDSQVIRACLFWSSWGLIGSVLAEGYNAGKLDPVERRFALDLLAYLCGKRLWKNTLPDDAMCYQDKLYRSLRKSDSPFVSYSSDKTERYQAWRTKSWEEANLRAYLHGLRAEDKSLLKLLADAGGALQQHTIMEQIPFLKGRSSASLRSLKSHINAGCRQLDCGQILAEGSGSGDYRIHEINRNLGELRAVVIGIAKDFDIPWHLLERSTAKTTGQASEGHPVRHVSPSRGWFVTENSGRRMIAGLVDAKGSCSCRMYDASTGYFVRKLPNAHGSFRIAFSNVIRGGREFRPPYQPDLLSTEKHGLPAEVLDAANSQI